MTLKLFPWMRSFCAESNRICTGAIQITPKEREHNCVLIMVGINVSNSVTLFATKTLIYTTHFERNDNPERHIPAKTVPAHHPFPNAKTPMSYNQNNAMPTNTGVLKLPVESTLVLHVLATPPFSTPGGASTLCFFASGPSLPTPPFPLTPTLLTSCSTALSRLTPP